MKKFINIILTLIVFTIISCNSNTYAPTTNNTPISSVVPTMSVREFLSVPNYNKECEKITQLDVVNQIQVGYHDIYPGRTTIDEIKQKLGEPHRTMEVFNTKAWYFDIPPKEFITITFTENLVDQVEILNYDLTYPSLYEIVNKFGCPELIVLINNDEHSADNYGGAIFIYPQIGIKFEFQYYNGLILSLESVAFKFQYIVPRELDTYLNEYQSVLYINSHMMKPVYWEDIVSTK